MISFEGYLLFHKKKDCYTDSNIDGKETVLLLLHKNSVYIPLSMIIRVYVSGKGGGVGGWWKGVQTNGNGEIIEIYIGNIVFRSLSYNK